MRIFYTSKFEKAFLRLPKEIQLLAIKKESLFRENMYNPKLRTHRLKGKLQGYLSFSIDYSYRVMFEVTDNGDAIFLNIGGHQIYK